VESTKNARVDGPTERWLADEGDRRGDVGAAHGGTDGVADAHEAGRDVPHHGAEVQDVVVAEAGHVGGPHHAGLGPRRRVGQGVGGRAPPAHGRARAHRHVRRDAVLRREEVVAPALLVHEGIGLVGTGVDGEAGLGGVGQGGGLVVGGAQAQCVVARGGAERTGGQVQHGRHARLLGACARVPEPHDARQRERRHHGGNAHGDRAGMAPRHVHHGEELGMVTAPLGDDMQKGGENVWISRIPIDPA